LPNARALRAIVILRNKGCVFRHFPRIRDTHVPASPLAMATSITGTPFPTSATRGPGHAPVSARPTPNNAPPTMYRMPRPALAHQVVGCEGSQRVGTSARHRHALGKNNIRTRTFTRPSQSTRRRLDVLALNPR
jgi:hypothetical protein